MFLSLFFFLLFFPCISMADWIFLPEGGSKTLEVSPSQDVYVSNGKVIKVKDFGGKILIFARKKGLSHIVNGNLQYKVRVLEGNTYRVLRRFQSILRKFMGLKVRIEGSQITVYGELLRLSDWKTLSQMASSIKSSNKKEPLYFFRASLSHEIQEEVKAFFSKRDVKAWSCLV